MGIADDIYTVQGHSDLSRDPRLDKLASTVQRIGRNRQGLDVFAVTAGTLVATDAAEAGSTTSVINATTHSADRGDIIRFTSGTYSGEIATVYDTTLNAIILSQTFPTAIATGVTFEILSPTVLKTDPTTGGLSVAIATPPTVNQGTASVSGPGWAMQFRGPLGLPTVNFNIAGIYEIPAVVVGDPVTGSPWNFISGRGLIQQKSTLNARLVVSALTTNQTLLPAQPLRCGATIFNNSTATLYIKYAPTASLSSWDDKLFPNQKLEVPFGTDAQIDGIWDAATGDAHVTEFY